MTNSHVKSQDHIEVIKCICLHSDELFKAAKTGVQPARKQENINHSEFLNKMILSANILLICSWINADEIKKVTYIISFSEIQKSLDGGKKNQKVPN